MPDQLPLWESASPDVVEDGYCRCGCGLLAPIAMRTNATKGHVRGQPVRYIAGHNRIPGGRGNPDKYTVLPNGCWAWYGALDTAGYGTLTLPGKLRASAHRYQYEKHIGPIPEGKQLHHRCHNRTCVNPAHLEPVSQLEHLRTHGKLSMPAARAIRERAADGESQRSLARAFDVAPRTIADVLRGKTWREEAA